MLKESDILYQIGVYWVMRDKHQGQMTYTIMKDGITHAESIDWVTYPDLSIAVSRCNYLAKRGI